MSTKSCLMLIVAILSSAVLADAERIDFLNNSPSSNIKARQIADEKHHYAVDAFSPVGLSLVPMAEYPGVHSVVSPVRLNILVGEHVDVYGLDVGILGNIVRREFAGIQTAVVFNQIGESSGGLQVAAANLCDGDFFGVQVGLFNHAEKGCALQIGVVNSTTSAGCVQIGVINKNEASPIKMMPILNVVF